MSSLLYDRSNAAVVLVLPGLLPTMLGATGSRSRDVVLEFFAAQVTNANTRIAYWRAARLLMEYAAEHGVHTFDAVTPSHIAHWVAIQSETVATTTVKQRLAAVKMLFDWLVVRRLISVNPAASVKSPRYSISKGKTPVLDPHEARLLIEAIDVSTIVGLRDRAMIGVMLYAFARIGAVLRMRVGDVFVQQRRLWLRLHEKGGKLHDMPCHHELEDWLDKYLGAMGVAEAEAVLFPAMDRVTRGLGRRPLAHSNAYLMVKRRAKRAGIVTPISNHSFRATGITAYLSNHGTLETAARLASHASTRTTQLYDRRNDAITLAEVERIRFE